MALENVQLDSITTSVWRNFYDTLKNYVTTVTITGSNTPISIQAYVASYTDKLLDSKDSYPIMVINTPEFSFKDVTFRNPEVEGRIEVEILANQAEAADKFSDKMQKAIRDADATLRYYGVDEITIEDTVNAFYERNGIKIHSRKIVWRFRFFE